MTKELKRFEEGPKAEIHIDLLKTTQKISNWKTPGHDGLHGFWFKKFTSILDRLALEMKEHTHSNGWPKKRPHWSKRTQAKEQLQTTTDA